MIDDKELYKMLENSYAWSIQVCDPVEYHFRQQGLLRTIGHFLLQKYKADALQEKKDEQTI